MKVIRRMVYDILNHDELDRFLNLLELEFHFVYFSSQQLQQRVAGISSIITKMTRIIEEEDMHSHNKNYCNFHFSITSSEYKNGDPINAKANIAEWLESKQMFDRIFSESSHHEIVKRSFPIVRFLYKNSVLPSDSIITIYRLAAGKHHSLRTCVFSLLSSLLEIVDIKDLNLVFTEIQRTPVTDIDIDFLNCIRAISLNSNLSSILHVSPSPPSPSNPTSTFPFFNDPQDNPPTKSEDDNP